MKWLGLAILIGRPYQIGDRVKVGDAYGEIDHIGLWSTKLTTPDDTRVTIPTPLRAADAERYHRPHQIRADTA